MFHSVPRENRFTPNAVSLELASPPIPFFEITLDDVKNVWQRYLNDVEWTKFENKTNLQKALVGKVAFIKEQLVNAAQGLNRTRRWLATPYTAEIAFFKSVAEKDFSLAENTLPFSLQLQIIERLAKSTQKEDSPAYRATLPLKMKLGNSGQWEHVAQLILELRQIHFATPPVLAALVQKANFVVPERFDMIKRMLRELHQESVPSLDELTTFIPLPCADIAAVILGELRATGCLNSCVYKTITQPDAQIKLLANPLANLRQHEKRRTALKAILEKVNALGILDPETIFLILKNSYYYQPWAAMIVILEELGVNLHNALPKLIKDPDNLHLLTDFIIEIRPFYFAPFLGTIVNQLIEKKFELWDFIEGISALHMARLDTPTNIMAILNVQDYTLEIADALYRLIGLQLDAAMKQSFCTQAIFNALLKSPVHALKIANLIVVMFHAQLASVQNIDLVIRQFTALAWPIAQILEVLSKADLASQTNFEKVCHYADCAPMLMKELETLQKNQVIITQVYLDGLLHQILFPSYPSKLPSNQWLPFFMRRNQLRREESYVSAVSLELADGSHRAFLE